MKVIANIPKSYYVLGTELGVLQGRYYYYYHIIDKISPLRLKETKTGFMHLNKNLNLGLSLKKNNNDDNYLTGTGYFVPHGLLSTRNDNVSLRRNDKF